MSGEKEYGFIKCQSKANFLMKQKVEGGKGVLKGKTRATDRPGDHRINTIGVLQSWLLVANWMTS